MAIRPVTETLNTRQGPATVPAPTGEFVIFDGETHYRIRDFHRMPPFFITLPSDTDLWMFITSGGGRRQPFSLPDGGPTA